MYALVLLFALILCVNGNPDDWGTVVRTSDGVQADSWIARLKTIEVTDGRFFEAASPTRPNAPNRQVEAEGTINIAPGGVNIGKGSALASRADSNAYPQSDSGKQTITAPGVSYAESGGTMLDIGHPYVDNPNGGTQISLIGVHIDACRATAISIPGKPVKFEGCGGGYISVSGTKVVDIPSLGPANFWVRVPQDQSQPQIANVIINEQVTTDDQGNPTVDSNGIYKYDPKATSGYINGVRIIIEHGEITALHAAVIRDASKTDSFASTSNISR
ncbi:uncharacterized protein BX664DRAFT_369429 [Halteromyces radiatus]|uniref:uncharacterized protein n=1 Tax=Halteromyces radiatus TaxID=101107 RepID=UPI00221EC63A|nr:uncharacterized protein BX664DRAFT_369429 [Halteromyces radiatus]KAI8077760.1 hypothetical protein BX664DRAFT_369429 [Halteromyces radiatus]